MARPSLDPDKARQGGGVEAGNYQIMNAKFQNLKTDRKPNQLNLVCEGAVLDKDGDPVRGADPVAINFSFGEKSHDAFTPGVGTSIDDESPNDIGKDVDAEGNTIYCGGDEQFNASCGAQVFFKSLVKFGFPKDVLAKCWAGSFTGLKFTLATLGAKEVNEMIGTRLNTKPMADGGTITYKIATKWLNPKYLGSPGTAAASTSTETAAPAGDKKTAEEVAVMCLKKVASTKKGEKNAIKSASSLGGFFTNAFAQNGFVKMGNDLPSVRKYVENQEWTKNTLIEIGATLDFNDAGEWSGKVTFPE